jgi:hypothetical protein
MVEARAKYRGGPAIVFRRAKNSDCIGWAGLVSACKLVDLAIDPCAPTESTDDQNNDCDRDDADNPDVLLRTGSCCGHADNLNAGAP